MPKRAIPKKKEAARKRLKSREETPKDGIRQQVAAQLRCYAHIIQLVKVRGSGNYLLWSEFLHYVERAFDMSLLLASLSSPMPADRVINIDCVVKCTYWQMCRGRRKVARGSVAHCLALRSQNWGSAMPTSSDFGKRKSKTPAGRHAQPPQRPDPATPRRDRNPRPADDAVGHAYLRLLRVHAGPSRHAYRLFQGGARSQ